MKKSFLVLAIPPPKPPSVNDGLIIAGRPILDKHFFALPKLFKTSDLGIDPLDVEAMTFAWLAKKRLEKEKIKLTSVTGSKPCLMGEVIN